MSVFIAILCPAQRDKSREHEHPYLSHLLFGTPLRVFLDAPVCHFDGCRRTIGKIVNLWQDDTGDVWMKGVTFLPLEKKMTHVRMSFDMRTTVMTDDNGLQWRGMEPGANYHVRLTLEADAWWKESKVIDVTRQIKKALLFCFVRPRRYMDSPARIPQ